MEKKERYPWLISYSLAFAGVLFILTFGTFVQASEIKDHNTTEYSAKIPEIGQPVVEEVTDYKELSSIVADSWEEDFFGNITVDSSSGQIIKDGEQESFAEEFGTSQKEAKQILRSEDSIEDFLQTSETDTVYQVQENESGDIEITAPYQTKRLIIDALVEEDIYHAAAVYLNTRDNETILQFHTEQETKQAYEQAVSRYGEDHCYIDEIFYAGDVMQTAQEAPLPGPSRCFSWGTAYMKMNYLKSQTNYYGYQSRVLVGVIDSGVDKSHSLFAGGRISEQSWNFVDGSRDISDSFGHGTHVSGIIADSTPSNVTILMLKVTNSKGMGSLYAVKNALRYAVNRKVQVVNMSMGIETTYASRINYLNDVIRKAYKRGIPICAAAGNKGGNVKNSYPANTKLPITVSAINENGTRGSYISPRTGKRVYYSNYGSTIDFAAPGTSIASAGRYGYYYYMTGTSMAAPHVTAAVAYLKVMQPNLPVKGVEQQLKALSVDLGAKGKDQFFGWGCPVMGNLFQKGIHYKKDTVKPSVKATKISSLKNVKKGIKISWKKVSKADKYKVYRKKGQGKYKQVAVVSAKQGFYIDKKVSEGKKYSYVIKVCQNGKWGKKSAGKGIVRIGSVSGLRAKKKSRTRLKLSWKKKGGVSGYQIRISSARNMKKNKMITLKKNSYQTKNLRYTYCYYQVRAYKKTGGKTYYSDWSGKKRIRMR